MTHLGLIVVGTLGTVAYVELLRNRPIEDSELFEGGDLFQELDDFLFGRTNTEVLPFGGMSIEVFPFEVSLREPPQAPQIDERVLFTESPLPHYRQIEHRPGGRRTQIRRSASGQKLTK